MKTQHQLREIVSGCYAAEFHYIDDLRCVSRLDEALIDDEIDAAPTPKHIHMRETAYLRSLLATFFLENGWEGDGEIGCILVAPCFSAEDFGNDGRCRAVFHVKQSNNGTSFLAIPRDLRLILPTRK